MLVTSNTSPSQSAEIKYNFGIHEAANGVNIPTEALMLIKNDA